MDAFSTEVREVLAGAEARRQTGAAMSRVILLSWQCFQAFRFQLKKKRRS